MKVYHDASLMNLELGSEQTVLDVNSSKLNVIEEESLESGNYVASRLNKAWTSRLTNTSSSYKS